MGATLKTLLLMRRIGPIGPIWSRPELTQPRSSRSLGAMANASKPKRRRKSVMVGVGLDSDGHKRLTTGPNFLLMGGSEDTHEVMTEKVIKINEKLAAKGKQLEQVSPAEFDDIAHSVGLHRHEPKKKDSGQIGN